MSRFSPQFLDELRMRTTLSTLIGRSTKLTRAGREWRACCPFHHEKTPSFYVNDDKGFYHCFGCSAHGDAIRWLTEARGSDFIDAVKELADAAGMALPAPDPRAAEREVQKSGLHDVMAAAADWFEEQLRTQAGTEARDYLARRRLSVETIKRFKIGYAPDRRDALKSALARFGEALLIEAGLLISVDDKTPYDRFRGRIMIPIRDPRGRVIAFGGRVLGPGEPKYLNSPDTPLFDKGRTLYNLDRAAPAARKAERLIVVEGYMDVIALAQAGIDEVVAPLGTALTEDQLDRLWRVVDVPTLCFDGDGAGRKAAFRAAERAMPLLAPGRSLNFATLPDGCDPDDLARRGGAQAVESVLSAAVPLVDLLWQHEVDALALTTPEARAGLKQRLAARTDTIADGDVRSHYRAAMLERLEHMFARPTKPSARFGRSTRQSRWSAGPPPPGARAKAIGGQGIDTLYARAILAGLLRHPVVIHACAEALAMLTLEDRDLDRLRTSLLESAFGSPSVDSDGAATIFANSGLEEVVSGLRLANGLAFSFTRSDADPEIARRDLAMAIEALASRPELDAALDAATARQAMGADADDFAEQMRLITARAEADRVLAALTQGDENWD